LVYGDDGGDYIPFSFVRWAFPKEPLVTDWNSFDVLTEAVIFTLTQGGGDLPRFSLPNVTETLGLL
jgi:hypothetical protein